MTKFAQMFLPSAAHLRKKIKLSFEEQINVQGQLSRSIF